MKGYFFMKSKSTSFVKKVLVFSSFKMLFLGTLVALPPANDNFANATALVADVPVIVSNVEATMETGEPKHSSFGRSTLRSIWYHFTPAANGYVELDTAGSPVDTVIAVYKGTAVNKLTLIEKGDDNVGAGTFAKIRMAVTKNQKYSVAIDGYSGSGNLQIVMRSLLQHQAAVFEAPLRIGNTFSGAFMPDVGKLTLTLTDKGSVSGKVFCGSKSHPVVSAVLVDKTIPIVIQRPDRLPIFITVTLQTVASGKIRPAAAFTAILGDRPSAGTAYLAPKFTAIESCPRIGTYHYFNTTFIGLGHSVCRMTVSATGVCKGVGYLADGTAYTYSAPILNNSGGDVLLDLANSGTVIPHNSLLGGKALLSGTINLTRVDASNTTASGSFSWFRVPGPGFAPLGIENQAITASGKNYLAPAPGNRLDPIFNVNGGSIRLICTSAGLAAVNQIATLTTSNAIQVSAPNPNAVIMKLDVKTGFLTGTVKFTGATKTTSFRSLLIPGVGFRGYNLAGNLGGPVTINSNP